MLPLRHLIDNRPLAELLRANWDADDAPFPWFRISSNAIYPFSQRGELAFLRFAPVGEKRDGQVEAELDFLAHLRRAGYGAPEPLPARDGRLLVTAETPWGTYLVTAFRRVPGIDLEHVGLNAAIAASYGRALGELHRLSAQYHPAGPTHWSHHDVLDWCRLQLTLLPDADAALAETDLLRSALADLPRSEAGYGLVHYDFECDNVLYDAVTGRCSAIDFDDAMLHWYAMDIEAALFSLTREVATPSAAPALEAAFLAGYAEIRPLPDNLAALRPLCRRFADLYRYTRVRRSLAEPTPDAPDWMVSLRHRLEARLPEFSARFGQKL